MAAKIFKIETCGECRFACETGQPGEIECRLRPPYPLTAYTAAYPHIRPVSPACAQGMPKPKPRAKKEPTNDTNGS